MTLIERAQADEPIVWNFLGDSITHGALHTWGRRDYVELFDERVRWQLRRSDDVVINAAYSGFSVPYLTAQLDRRCLRFRPDVVCLMLGTNDAGNGTDGVAAFERGYQAIIARIQAESGARVLLQTPNPLDWPHAQSRASLPDYVAAIRRLAAALALPLCDHYAAWEDYAARIGACHYLLNDPLHPNADGHLFMANTLLTCLGYGPMTDGTPLDAYKPA